MFRILMLILMLFIMPELLGLLILRFTRKEKNNIILAFVIGYLMEFAIGQILTVPMIFYDVSFMNLFKVYMTIIIVLSAISLVINSLRVKELFISIIDYIKKVPKLLSLATIILIILQVYAFIGYAHIDDDDAFYVATATTSVQTNTLFKYSATTGSESGEQNILRYRLGPFPIYSAILAQATSIHPATISHVIMPITLVPITYMIYGLIADSVFKKDKKNTFLFLIILNVLFIWGNYSVRNNFTFLLFRIWQGKAILANIIIPAIWLLVIKAEENEFKLIDFILLLILNFAGCFTTTMGIALAPITTMLTIFILEISKINFKNLKEFKIFKSIKNLSLCLISCLPSIVYGLIYFFYFDIIKLFI